MKRIAELGGFGLGFVIGMVIGIALCCVVYALSCFG